MVIQKGALLCVAFALLPSLCSAFRSSVMAKSSVISVPNSNKISSSSAAAASANDGDLFFDESSSDRDTPQSSASSGEGQESESMSSKKKKELSQFAQGAQLQQIRMDLESFRENLKWAQAINDTKRIDSLRLAIEETELKDPEIVYKKALFLIAEAKSTNSQNMKQGLKDQLIQHWEEQAELARTYLPRFQRDGLWVGTYGSHGPQLINVTYSGDTIIAQKVTGDETVPRGEVTFTADLSPPPLNASAVNDLSGVESILEEKYGGTIYPGRGQLAKKGFQDSKYIDGLFIVYDDARFSFSWVPSKHHVFFVRPSATETLRLLRDVISKEDEVENQRTHLAKCFDMDMTTSIAREQARKLDGVESDPFRRISLQKELELLGDFTSGLDGDKAGRTGNLFAFWKANKWKKYIDRVLGSEDGEDVPPILQ